MLTGAIFQTRRNEKSGDWLVKHINVFKSPELHTFKIAQPTKAQCGGSAG